MVAHQADVFLFLRLRVLSVVDQGFKYCCLFCSETPGHKGTRYVLLDGWYLVATKGCHRQYKHHEKSGRVTIAGHPKDKLARGTLIKCAMRGEKHGQADIIDLPDKK